MIDAGVTSLKIEGRLKDEAYVKNITAYYRKRIDAILKRRNDLKRKSSGKCSFTFEPNPDKSFSRGFTNYFLKGRSKEPVYSPETPKSKGEFVGTVKELKKGFFTVAGLTPVHNGDGLCFVNEEGVLQGFRVNKVEENKVFPLEQPVLKPKTRLFRNYDHEFEKQLAKESSQRKISVSMKLESVENGFTLYVEDEDGNHVTQFAESAKETARSEQKENQIRQLSKLGGTPYEVSGVDICFDEPYFIPSSLLADLRREAIAELTEERVKNYHRNEVKHTKTSHSFVTDKLTYLGNVTNSRARSFYSQHGVEKIDNGFELEKPDSVALMFTKHCVKYAMGWCRKYQNVKECPAEPLTLEYKGQKLRLEFDCRNCEMKIYKHL